MVAGQSNDPPGFLIVEFGADSGDVRRGKAIELDLAEAERNREHIF